MIKIAVFTVNCKNTQLLHKIHVWEIQYTYWRSLKRWKQFKQCNSIIFNVMAYLFENRLQANLVFRWEHSFSVFFFFLTFKIKAERFYEDSSESKEGVWLWHPRPSKVVAKAKAAKTKEAALKGVCGNKKTKSHMPSPHGSPRYRCPKGHPNYLGRTLPAETRLTATLLSGSAWPPSQPWRSRTASPWSLDVRPAGPGQTGCEEALWPRHGQGQHPDQAWWRAKAWRSTGDCDALHAAHKIGII